MSTSTELGEVRDEPDLREGFRRRIWELAHQAIKIGQGTLMMTSSQIELWLEQQFAGITESWVQAVSQRQLQRALVNSEGEGKAKREKK